MGELEEMTSRWVQLAPPSICSEVNKLDHVSTQNCNALPHNLQRTHVFFRMWQDLCVVAMQDMQIHWRCTSHVLIELVVGLVGSCCQWPHCYGRLAQQVMKRRGQGECPCLCKGHVVLHAGLKQNKWSGTELANFWSAELKNQCANSDCFHDHVLPFFIAAENAVWTFVMEDSHLNWDVK